MAGITPQMVKTLREKTGAGMGDCKKALDDADGDMNLAIEILRKKGAASAAKRADRSAKEGTIAALTTPDGKKAVIIEVNSETDFVARNENFVNYVNSVALALLNNNAQTIDELMELKIENDTIKGMHNEILAKFGEKIEIRRFETLTTNGYFAEYIHAGSKLAVLVEVSAETINEKAHGLIRDIAMQIAAMNPQFIDRSFVTQDTIQKEIEIYKQQAIDSGKKPELAERIATGKLDKFFQEQCLVEQTFVKDSNKVISDVIKEISAETGSEVKINSFRRYYLGEE
ncbi:MAG: Elongation factor Ts [Bacteroidota bacterium]|nr:Elongation factor Ts [Bacteroidota bacterium]